MPRGTCDNRRRTPGAGVIGRRKEMSIIIRDVREHELDLVLALNNAAGPGILPMDAGKLRFFWENADYFRVAEKDGHLAGFLVALSQDAPHDSPNFLWFRERYPAQASLPVAERAGVNPGMFHYHFKSKDNFLRAVLPMAVADLVAEYFETQTAPGRAAGGSGRPWRDADHSRLPTRRQRAFLA